jgi:hypothetical protein
VLLAAALAASGCGKSPTGPSTFNQTINGSVSTFTYTSHAFTAPRAGTMTIALTWQAGTDRDLDLYLTDGNCADFYGVTPCVTLAESFASSGTSETVTFPAQVGRQFQIWVDSFSTTNHSYSLRITIE